MCHEYLMLDNCVIPLNSVLSKFIVEKLFQGAFPINLILRLLFVLVMNAIRHNLKRFRTNLASCCHFRHASLVFLPPPWNEFSFLGA